MAVTTGAFPYDIDNLLGGAVRVLYAPISTAIPTGIASVISTLTPYAPAATWVDFGATKDAFTYTRSFDTEGYEIQQVPGAILEDITDLSRTISVSVAELRPAMLRMIEQGSAPSTVAASATAGAQTVTKFGSFSSVTQYRIAFISRRHQSSGTVTEAAGATRGRFFMGVGYRCQITADEVEYEGDKGNLSAASLSFKLFPESGVTSGEEYGFWSDEAALPAV